ncbi:MAG TPA: SCP2 sterol-binding domain-containing protein [Myxococcaceae bacterium]|nr:SCP2 sterol-binding domain-containing protein [Myxococcaceae bacterium]
MEGPLSWLDTLEKIRNKDFKKATASERDETARDIVNITSYACAVVAVSPLPFSDALLMLPIQTGMVMTVGHVYGRRLDEADARDLIVELMAVAGVSFLARQGIKALLPVVGALLTIPAAFAASWAMGRVAMEYFKNPGMTKDAMRDAYRRAKDEAASRFSRSAFDEFRQKNEGRINEVAKDQKRAAPPPASPPRPVEEPAEPAPAKKRGKTIGRGTRAKAPAKATEAKKSIGRKQKPEAAPRSPVQEIVEVQLPRKILGNKDAAARIGALVHLDLSGPEGGQWTVDLTKLNDPVSRGLRGQPKMTVRAEDQFFLKLVQGKADPQVAVFTGKLKLEPLDVELATNVAKILTG